MRELEVELKARDATIKQLQEELKSTQMRLNVSDEATFSIEKFKDSDEDIQFYTGLPSYHRFHASMTFLNPGKDGRNVKLWKGNEGLLVKDTGGKGRPRKLNVDNQLFLLLVKLKVGLFHKHLAHLFGISESTVSRVFTSWLNFLYLRLNDLKLWLSKQIIQENMPIAFLEKYPSTRVIIDATEITCEVPSSFVSQSNLYSHYKSRHTFKGLIGISPKGTLTFVSELFTGCTSDRECVIKSGLLERPFDVGDSVMADKGFTIGDLLSAKGVTLNIPPFLRKEQFSTQEIEETQDIAALRIHVERKIQRIKTFHIFDKSIPVLLAPLANQMWTVCAILSNLQSPLLKEDE